MKLRSRSSSNEVADRIAFMEHMQPNVREGTTVLLGGLPGAKMATARVVNCIAVEAKLWILRLASIRLLTCGESNRRLKTG